MSRAFKLFSVLLIFLLLIAFTIPTVCAEKQSDFEEPELGMHVGYDLAAAKAAAPVVIKFVLDGITFFVRELL